MTDTSNERAINLAEPLEAIVADADVIVHATVLRAEPDVAGDADRFGAQDAVVLVDEVLKGDLTPGEVNVAKPDSAYYLTARADAPAAGRHRGLFVLRAGPDGLSLFGYHGVHDDAHRPEFDRLLAGLPGDVAPPTDAEILELAARADAIVVGAAVASGPVDFRRGATEYTAAATVEVHDVLQGELAEAELPVIRGRAVFAIGARWGFPTDLPTIGVYFLDTTATPAVVLNPVDPFLYQPRAVAQVLAR